MLESKNEQVAFRAITVYLDRALGKAALQGGRQDVTRSEAVEIVRQERATKMDAEIPAARAMLARLIVRRQLDRDKRSALWRLLTDIADHPPEKRLGGDRRPSREHNGLGLLTRRRAGRRDRYLARNGYAAQQIQGPVDRERRDNCAAY